MINKLTYRPEEMKHLFADNVFFAVSDENGVYCYVALGLKHNEGLVHINVLRWSKTVRKAILMDWELILKYCRAHGCKRLTAANDDYQDKRWPKFIKLFGFPPPRIIALAQREV